MPITTELDQAERRFHIESDLIFRFADYLNSSTPSLRVRLPFAEVIAKWVESIRYAGAADAPPIVRHEDIRDATVWGNRPTEWTYSLSIGLLAVVGCFEDARTRAQATWGEGDLSFPQSVMFLAFEQVQAEKLIEIEREGSRFFLRVTDLGREKLAMDASFALDIEAFAFNGLSDLFDCYYKSLWGAAH